ncbi:MAG: oligosaccharide flippase family protein [Candidatus Atribacteria bacterium]|nr:oligosaccharide flippase family protein [Candidatus Atribacteria bacterium]
MHFNWDREFLFNYFWRIVQFVCKSIVPLFINFYSAKVLLPQAYSEIVVYLTYLSIVNLFSNFGLSSSALRYTAEDSVNGNANVGHIFSSVSLFALFVSIVGTFLFYGLTNYSIEIIVISFVYVLLNPLVSILDGIFLGLKRIKVVGVISLVVSIFSILIFYYLIKEFKVIGVLISYSVYYTFIFVFYLYFRPFKFKGFSIAIAKNVIGYALVVGVGSIAFFLYTRVDILFLDFFGYDVEISQYELITRIFEVCIMPIVLVAQVASVYFIKLKQNRGLEYVYFLYRRLLVGLLLVGILFSFLLYYGATFFITYFYPEYSTQQFDLILLILSLIIPLKLVGVFMTTAIITPLGFAKIISLTTLFFGILNVVLDYLGIQVFGFIAVFWVTLLVHSLNIVLQQVLFFIKIRNVKDDFKIITQ